MEAPPQDVYVCLDHQQQQQSTPDYYSKRNGCMLVLPPNNRTQRLRTVSDLAQPSLIVPKEHSNALAKTKLIQASIICATFMFIEVIAGWFANSLALITDASHLLSDLSAFLISLFALWVSDLPGTHRLSFGYHRAEILGALTSVVLIWILTIFLVSEACHRIITPKPVNGCVMFITAFFGTLANVAMTFILGVHSHGIGGQCHGHDHEHHHDGQIHDHEQHLQGHHHCHHEHHHNTSTGLGQEHQGHIIRNDLRFNDKDMTTTTTPRRNDELTITIQHQSLIPNNNNNDTPNIEMPSTYSTNSTCDNTTTDHALGDLHDRLIDNNTEDFNRTTTPLENVQNNMHHNGSLTEYDHTSQNVNLRAAYVHALGDLIQNIGVLVAAGLIWYDPSWTIVDPICTFLFSILVLITTFSILREGVPREIDVADLKDELTKIRSVVDVHDLHVWSLSVGKPSLACHMVIDSEEEARRVLRVATRICQQNYGILHTTIQTDFSANKQACDTNAHSKCH